MLQRTYRVVPYILIATLAFVGTYTFLASELGTSFRTFLLGDEHMIASLVAIDPCPGDAASSLDCWDEYYQKLLDTYGSHVTLFELKSRYEGGGYPRLFCHTILHEIGGKAGEEYGNVADAYAKGDTFCRSGYYHGVLEGIFGEDAGGEILAQLDSLCTEVNGKERYSYDYYACVHGIGHGLMAYFAHDLFDTLDGCDKLTGEWEQSSCYGGVFMENVISNSEDSPSKFLKDDDPLYPCNVVEDQYRYQCYLMQTSYMLVIFDGDFGKAFDTCAAIEEKYRVPCYQSLGRDASGWSYGSPENVRIYCGSGRTSEQKGHCLVGAAVDFIQSVGAEAARDLCKRGDPEAQAMCSKAVEYQLSSL